MNFRHLAVMARQHSFALKSCESFWGLPKRGLALILANALFWQPLLANADGIVVSAPGTSLDAAGNGVPIVNIATPNDSGLSHNQFKDYNVGANGVILNNATDRTQSTQLGGIILGNPNLQGRAANIILNEVNGGSPSQLRGYTEVAGPSAHVIVANPYGISCNGCGFINTPKATLTTGKPILDNGRLDRYQVDDGAVSIDGQGLNASNVDRFEIITRSAKINAQINARNLTVIAGRNDVNAQTLTTTARVDDGSAKPELAIDSSALGGMYAGAIKLVGTEAGVGVKLDGTLAASGGDIQLDANGRLSLAQAAASDAVNIKAVSVDVQGPVYAGTALEVQAQRDLNSRKSLAARDSIKLASAGQLTNNGIIEAGVNADNTRNTTGDVSLTAQTVNNTGNSVIANRTLTVNAAQSLNNQGGTLSAKQLATLVTGTLDNQNKGQVLSSGKLDLKAGQLLNTAGLVTSNGGLTATVTNLDNSGGTLTGAGDVQLDAQAVLNNQRQGLISAGNRLTVSSSTLNNQNGSLLGSAIAVDFSTLTGDLNNTDGLIRTAGPLTFTHLRDLNNQGGEISTTQNLSLSGRTLDNSAGKLISNNLLVLKASTLINQGGLMSGWQGLSVSGATLDNRNNGTLSSRYGDLNATLTASLLNSGAGALVSQKALTVNTAELDNSAKGIVSSGGTQTLTVDRLLNNTQGGLIDSGGTLDLQAQTLSNAGGTVNAQQTLTLTATHLDNSAGTLIGNGAVNLDLLGALTNTQGKLASAGALLLKRASEINNQGGQLASQGLMSLFAGSLDNRNRGTVAANGTLVVTTTGAVQNSADGLIYSQNADLQLKAARFDNAKGSLQSQTALNLDISDALDNQSGKVIVQAGDVDIRATAIDNRGGTLASLKGALQAKALGGWLRNDVDLSNNGQTGTIQAQRLSLSSASLNNNGGRIAAQTGDSIITTGDFDNRDGGLYAKGALSVTAIHFDNRGKTGGQVAGEHISLALTGALNNQKGLIESAGTLNLNAASVDNQAGRLRALGSSGSTTFQIGGLLDNRNGLLETANTDLTLAAGSLQNTGGTVLHVGTGRLDIAPSNLNSVGGNLVTRGDLSVNQDTWTNSSVIQAGRLTVNVNQFDQTPAGQLLASQRFTGTGGNWFNNGLIASDGNLDLTLSSALNNTGRISSLGNLNVSAAQLNLSNTASLTGGGITTANIIGTLNNYGRLTSAIDLNLTAGAINNYATLGSAQKLTASTGALLNDHGLIFSGGDMGLRVDTLNNSYADIYSLGNLSIDRDGKGGLASSLLNSSSTIQSDGDMNLVASTIKNLRSVLTTNDGGIYTASITEFPCQEGPNYAGDCKGPKVNHLWQIVQRDKFEVTDASAASSISAGKNLTITGGDLLNASSSIGTAGNLNISVNSLANKGIETGETETWRLFVSERTRNAGGWYSAAAAFNNQYSSTGAAYNPKDLSGLEAAMASFIGMTEHESTALRRVTQIDSGDQRYAAVIQAAGAATVKVQGNLDNSVVRPGFNYVGAGTKTSTGASGASASEGFSTRITLNPQLPADLAQQQLNPLSLPGFSLPVGQNGLFRLSGQGGNAAQAPVTGIDGLAINRVQGLPDSHFVSNPHKYLIETNPALTNLKQFMGSDYLLSHLGYDPDQSQKRLGDGLYEQRLIQQAVIARTGQRFIDGQTSDAAMFKYLMDNALQSKQPLNLAVGVSLTAEQVAALTHDIVWMETAQVNGEQVLVPVLYLAQANNRLAPNGALITASDLSLVTGTDLNNVGTLRATHNLTTSVDRNIVNSGLVEASNRLDLLAGNNLTNRAGGIIAGRDVSLSAMTGDLLNERTVTHHQSSSGYRTERYDVVDNAARIEAANNLSLTAGRDVNSSGGVIRSGADTLIQAGRDVNLTSAEQRNANAVTTLFNSNSTTQYGTVIEAGRDFRVQAGRDISAIASQIEAKRDVVMAATGDLNLSSAANEQHSAFNSKKVKSQEDHVQQVSTTVRAGGDVALSAGQDLALIASRVSAGKEAYLYAGGDLALNAAQNSDYSYYRKTKTSSSGLSSTQKTRIDSSSSTTQQGSSVSADTVVVRAGQDIGTSASNIVSTNGTSLIAGRNVVIDGATETFEQSHSSSTKKSGLLSSGGIGFTLGSTSNQNTSTSSTETTRASTVGSVLGNVNIEAGKDLTIRGSDVVAGKDIRLVGQNVNILADENNNRSEQTSKSKSSGLTLALSGTVGSAVNTAYQTAKQAKNEDDSRLSALQGVKAGLTGVQAWQAAQQNGGMTANNADQFVGISVSLGSQKSSSTQTQEQTVNQGSSLTAGHNLTIVAAGNGTPGADGDIHIQGSKLQASNEMLLAAERDIRLEAAANTQKLEGKNSSSGGAIGANIGVGSQVTGLSIFANANKGTGSEKGNGTTWTETTLDAGKQISLISGRDTALKGAQVSADKITANVGRDLTLQSLQDSDDYTSKQTNVSGGASVAIIGKGGSANLSVSQNKIDSNYKSVQEQTGLFAGKGGYQVDVKNHTQLEGSVIASTADADKNRLSTGTLGWSDIKNKAEYTSKLQSASVSSSNDGTGKFVSNMPSGTLIAFNHGDKTSGTTSSAISNGTLEIRDPAKQQQDVATLSHDVEHANGTINPIFDKEKEQKRLQQVQLIGDIGTQAADIIRTQGKIEAANAQKDPKAIAAARDKLIREGNIRPTDEQITTQVTNTVMAKYGVGGDYPRVAQAVTAALQGLVGGDIGSAVAGASAPYLAQVIKKTTEGKGNNALNTMAHAVLGAVVAQAQGNSALAGGAGAATGEFIAHQLYPGIKTSNLTQEQKETVVALSGLAAALAGGIAGGDLGGAVVGAKAGSNAVENNYLSKQQKAQKNKELAECSTISCKASTATKWAFIDVGQDASFGLGAAAGIPLGLNDAIDGIVHTAGNLKETYQALRAVVESGGVWDTVKQSYIDRIDKLETEYQRAGPGGSFQAGVETGKLLTDMAGVLSVGVGLAKGGALLAEKVTAKVAARTELAGAKGTPAWNNAISKADGDFGYLPPVRQNYVKDVYDLQGAVDKMRASGASAEEVAKYAYSARNELKVKYREYTPPDMLDVIDARNLERYGNKIGPAFDDLVKKGKTFDQIIESSTRAGGGDLFQ